jgi:hypothetical protein
MNISLSFRANLAYDLTEDENEKVKDTMLEIVKPVLHDLYINYSNKHSSPAVLNEMLMDIRKSLFKDTGVKLVFRFPVGNRRDVGEILNHVRIKMEDKELNLIDYIYHLAVLKNNKAFIQIK